MSKKKNRMRAATPYLWLLPSFALMAVMVLLPIIKVFQLSFSEISRAGLVKGWAGLDNFKEVLGRDTFWMVFKNTVIWTVCVVGISTFLGLVLGILLNIKFHGRKIVRAIIVFPWATSLIIQASIWKFILNLDYGSLNAILMKLHIISSPVNWTSTPGWWFFWENVVGIFVTVPFVTFCVLSGLQSIDDALYESADIDGATRWQSLRFITLPLLKNSLTVSTVLNIIYVFNSFPIIWAMTKGDPANRTDTLVTYLYKLAFTKHRFGQASAVSIISFVILCVAAVIYMSITMRGESDEQ